MRRSPLLRSVKGDGLDEGRYKAGVCDGDRGCLEGEDAEKGGEGREVGQAIGIEKHHPKYVIAPDGRVEPPHARPCQISHAGPAMQSTEPSAEDRASRV
jgi:hypothetical protein